MDLKLDYLRSSARVGVRYPESGDWEEFVALRRASEDFHKPWEPLPRPGIDPYARPEFEGFLAGHGEQARRFRHLLCDREAGHIIGLVNVSEIVRGCFHSAYLGYWIGAAYARQGLMREGLSLVVSHAFEELELHRLEANIRPENEASIALVKSLGFRCEGYSPRYLKIDGEWCDHERWAILADD